MKAGRIAMCILTIMIPVAGGLLVFSCSQNAGQQEKEKEKVVVATAANVQFAMDELAAVFGEAAGVKVEVVLSSSGKLTAQIRQGAPFDLLVSADEKYPQTLYEEGFSAAAPRVYAYGALVMWTRREDVDLSSGLSGLLKPEIGKVAIANPRTAPYGEEAVRALRYFGLYEAVLPKLVYGESIAQTNQYVMSRACDVGLTAKSVVLSPEMQGQGRWIAVDPAAYRPIAQAVIITRHGQQHNPGNSRRFHDFLFSPQGRAIFERYGYGLPGEQ